jgi:hypothetical protein
MIVLQLRLRSDSANARRPWQRVLVGNLKDDTFGSEVFDIFTMTELGENLIRVLPEHRRNRL